MPASILPPIPSAWLDANEEARRRRSALIAVAQSAKLPSQPPTDDPLATLRWATEATKVARSPRDHARINQAVTAATSPTTHQALWQKTLSAISLPFDAFAEGASAVVSTLPVPQPEIFRQRGAKSRAILADMFSGRINPAHAAGLLRAAFQERSGLEQFVLGLALDPTVLVPGVTLGKLAAKAGAKGVALKAATIAGQITTGPIINPAALVRTGKLTLRGMTAGVMEAARGVLTPEELRRLVPTGGAATDEELIAQVNEAYQRAVRRNLVPTEKQAEMLQIAQSGISPVPAGHTMVGGKRVPLMRAQKLSTIDATLRTLLIHLPLNEGVRETEATALTFGQAREAITTGRLRVTVGPRTRFVPGGGGPIKDETLTALRAAVDATPNALDTDRLFTYTTKGGKRVNMSERRVGQEFQAIAKAAGLDVRWTDLRATNASAQARAYRRAGVSVSAVAETMGHESAATTYRHYLDDLGDVGLIPEEVVMRHKLASPDGLAVAEGAAERAQGLLAQAATEPGGKVTRRKGRVATPQALKKEAAGQLGMSKILSLPIDEQYLLAWPEAIRPHARIVLQLGEATDYLRVGTDLFDSSQQRVAALTKLKTAALKKHQNFTSMEEAELLVAAKAERNTVREQLNQLAAGIGGLVEQLGRQVSPDPTQWASAIDAIIATAPSGEVVRRAISHAEVFAKAWKNHLRSPYASKGAGTKVAKALGLERVDVAKAPIIQTNYEAAPALAQREQAYAFITNPNIRTLLRHFNLPEIDGVFHLGMGQPVRVLREIGKRKSLQHVLGLDFKELDLVGQKARIDTISQNLLLNNIDDKLFITEPAYAAKLRGERPARKLPTLEPEPSPRLIDYTREGGQLDMGEIVAAPQSVEDVVKHGSRPSPTLQQLHKLMERPGWEGSGGRVARRVAEMLMGRGALANAMGQQLLGFAEASNQSHILAARAMDILHPILEPLDRLWDGATSGFKLELHKTNSAIVGRMRELLGDEAPVLSEEVMRHQLTVLEGVPIKQLDEVYVLTQAQRDAIITYRHAAAQATANLDKGFPGWNRSLLGTTKAVLEERRLAAMLPYYMPRSRAASGALPRPGFASKESTFLHDRIIDNAADAVKKNVDYASPAASLHRYIVETNMVVAEHQLRQGMAPFAIKVVDYHHRVRQVEHLENLRLRVAAGEKLADMSPDTLQRLQAMFGSEQVTRALGSKAGAEEMRGFVQTKVRLEHEARDATKAVGAASPKIPALQNMRFDEAGTKLIRDWMVDGHKQWQAIANPVNQLSSGLRLLRAGPDFSVIGIHGALVGMQYPGIWMRANIVMAKMLSHAGPGGLEARRLMLAQQAASPGMRRFIQYGGVTGQIEQYAALTTGGPAGVLKKVPLWGAVLDRAEAGFTIWVNEARRLMWEALEHKAKNLDGSFNEEKLFELAASISKRTGAFNTALNGIPQLQRAVESGMVSFASIYRRAAMGMVADLMAGPKTLRGSQALLSVGALLRAGAIFSTLIYLSGNNDKVFDPRTPRFMAAKIGNSYMGIGTAYYSLVRLAGSIVDKGINEPGTFLSIDPRDNALLKYWRSQAAPLTGLGLDFVLGSTYTGDPLRNDDGFIGPEVMKHLGFQSTPFMVEDMIRGVTTDASLEAPAYLAEGVGMRAFPESLYQRRDWLREAFVKIDGELGAWRITNPGKGWADLSILQQRELWNRHPELAEIEQQIDTRTLESGRANQQRIARYLIELRSNTTQADSTIQSAARTFDRGFLAGSNRPVDGKWFRDQVSVAGAVKRAMDDQTDDRHKSARDELDRAKQDKTDKSQSRLDALFNDYINKVVLNPTLTNDDGFFLVDAFEHQLDGWRTRNGEVAYQYVRERLRVSRDWPLTMLEYIKGKEQLREYWTLADTLWPRDSWQHTLVINSLSLPSLSRAEHKHLFPQVVPLLRQLEAARERWRRFHPEEDWLLVKFYDYTPAAPVNVQRRQAWMAQRTP